MLTGLVSWQKSINPLLLPFQMLNFKLYMAQHCNARCLLHLIFICVCNAVQRGGGRECAHRLLGCRAKRGPSHYRLCRDQWQGNAHTLHSTFHSKNCTRHSNTLNTAHSTHHCFVSDVLLTEPTFGLVQKASLPYMLQ